MMTALKHTLKNNRFFWRYFLNRKGSFKYLIHPLKISNPVVVKMLDELKRNGVAIGNAEDIIGKRAYLSAYATLHARPLLRRLSNLEMLDGLTQWWMPLLFR